VSVTRALATTPAILLLDEPTSALDEEAKGEVEKLIFTVARQSGLTCVMVLTCPQCPRTGSYDVLDLLGF
jgi:putative ABC transport system ATP-binding protein